MSPRTRDDVPAWLTDLLGVDEPPEGGDIDIGGQPFVLRGGVLRQRALRSKAQRQTEDVFAFKWHKRETFESPASSDRMGNWLRTRYGPVSQAPWFQACGQPPVVLDAGCGAGFSTLAWWGAMLERVHYLGVDVSEAVEVARLSFQERGLPGAFMQADITTLPLPEGSVDVVFCEGALHHTDSTEGALKALARVLKPGGFFLFYVYRVKGPMREFTDDYIRARLQVMTPEEVRAWCDEAGLAVTREVIEEAGITIIASKEDRPQAG